MHMFLKVCKKNYLWHIRYISLKRFYIIIYHTLLYVLVTYQNTKINNIRSDQYSESWFDGKQIWGYRHTFSKKLVWSTFLVACRCRNVYRIYRFLSFRIYSKLCTNIMPNLSSTLVISVGWKLFSHVNPQFWIFLPILLIKGDILQQLFYMSKNVRWNNSTFVVDDIR